MTYIGGSCFVYTHRVKRGYNAVLENTTYTLEPATKMATVVRRSHGVGSCATKKVVASCPVFSRQRQKRGTTAHSNVPTLPFQMRILTIFRTYATSGVPGRMWSIIILRSELSLTGRKNSTVLAYRMLSEKDNQVPNVRLCVAFAALPAWSLSNARDASSKHA